MVEKGGQIYRPFASKAEKRDTRAKQEAAPRDMRAKYVGMAVKDFFKVDALTGKLTRSDMLKHITAHADNPETPVGNLSPHQIKSIHNLILDQLEAKRDWNTHSSYQRLLIPRIHQLYAEMGLPESHKQEIAYRRFGDRERSASKERVVPAISLQNNRENIYSLVRKHATNLSSPNVVNVPVDEAIRKQVSLAKYTEALNAKDASVKLDVDRLVDDIVRHTRLSLHFQAASSEGKKSINNVHLLKEAMFRLLSRKS